jgi:hypothetical protein
MLDALGACEALEGTFEVPTEHTNSLETRPWLQRRNIDYNEGGNFIIGDGCVHF